FGVVGDPVAHSLSPLIHNRALRHEGFNAVYLPCRVRRSELAGFLKHFDHFRFRGYSVTIPHKEAACTLAVRQDDLVKQIQAANTLVRIEEGWSAYNTDAQAAVETLEANMPMAPDGQPLQLHTRTALLLGAGGVARAVAHALRGRVSE